MKIHYFFLPKKSIVILLCKIIFKLSFYYY